MVSRHSSARVSTLLSLTGLLRKEVMSLITWKKTLDAFAALLALSGLVIGMIEAELYEQEASAYIYYDTARTKIIEIAKFDESDSLTLMRVYVSITSALLVLVVFARVHVSNKIADHVANLRGLPPGKEHFSPLKLFLLLLVLLIHSPPKLNANMVYPPLFLYFTLDTLLTCLMTIRFLFLPFIDITYSKWGNYLGQETCYRFNTRASWFFIFKCQWKESPVIVVGSIMLMSIVWGGYLIQVAERPFQYISEKNWNYVWNGMWTAAVAMTTVGYGDYHPQTILGRVVTVLICIWGNFLTSIMVISLFKLTELDSRQRRVLRKLREKDLRKMLISSAQKTIHHFMKYCFHFRSLKVYWRAKSYDLHHNLVKACLEFANLRKNLLTAAESLDYWIDYHAQQVEVKMSKSWMAVKMAKYDLQILFDQQKIIEKKQDQVNQLSLLLHDMTTKLHTITSSYEKASKFRKGGFGTYAHDLLVSDRDYMKEVRAILELESKDLNMTKGLIQQAFRFHQKIDDLIVTGLDEPEKEQKNKDTTLVSNRGSALLMKRSIHRISRTLDNIQAAKLLKNLNEKGLLQSNEDASPIASPTLPISRRSSSRAKTIAMGLKGKSVNSLGNISIGSVGEVDSTRAMIGVMERPADNVSHDGSLSGRIDVNLQSCQKERGDSYRKVSG